MLASSVDLPLPVGTSTWVWRSSFVNENVQSFFGAIWWTDGNVGWVMLLLILVAFLWVSSAVSTHSLAKAAYSKGVRIENVPQKDWTIAPPPPPEPTLATADSGLIVPAAATELSPPAPGTEDGSGSAGADETAHATPDTDEEPA